jgi:serine/threonine-protein kinase RsbW
MDGAHSGGVPSSSHEALRVERRDLFRLPARGASVADARRRMRTKLREWGVGGELSDDAELVLSELFTNAVRYTGSELVRCEFRVVGGLLRLEVTDQGDGLSEPLPRVAETDDECGRGLLLVTALSTAWGVRAVEGGHGRVVWAELGTGGAAGPASIGS